MAQKDLLGSDKLNVAYQKINENFDELYAGAGGDGGASDLANLSDVALTLPIENKQALIFDNVANKWKNEDIPRKILDLEDTNILTPAPSQILQFNGSNSKWESVNSPYALQTQFVEFQILSAVGGV